MVLGLLAIIMAIYLAYSLLVWTGTISWKKETESFEVWNSAIGGTKLSSPYTLTEPSLPVGDHSYSFYIENTGTIAITVIAITISQINCTSSWSNGSLYDIAVGNTRVQAILTLTITDSGSYSWEFTIM